MCSNSYTTPAAVGNPVTFCLPRESFIFASFQHLCIAYLQCGLEIPSDYKMLYSREHSTEHLCGESIPSFWWMGWGCGDSLKKRKHLPGLRCAHSCHSWFRTGFVADTLALFAVLSSVPDLLAAEVTGLGGQWNGCSSMGCFVFPHHETLPLPEEELNFLPLRQQ